MPNEEKGSVHLYAELNKQVQDLIRENEKIKAGMLDEVAKHAQAERQLTAELDAKRKLIEAYEIILAAKGVTPAQILEIKNSIKS